MMSYRAERQRIERKIGTVKGVAIISVLLFVLAVCVFSLFVPAETWKYYFSLPNAVERRDGEMTVAFLDVGQGDSTLVCLPDGKVLLVDGGNGDGATTSTIMRYLNALKIDTVDYLILTHADSDHCGALDTIVQYKDVGTVYLPKTTDDTTNAEYAEFLQEVHKADCAVEVARRGLKIASDEEKYPYAVTCLYPYSQGQASVDQNENSSVWAISYQGTDVLLTGDAPTSVEEILMRDYRLGLLDFYPGNLTDVEILKVAHHGSLDSTSSAFVSFLGVETAVCSVGKDNLYGHPSSEVTDRLTTNGAIVYRTDLQSTVVAVVKADGTYQMQTLQ